MLTLEEWTDKYGLALLYHHLNKLSKSDPAHEATTEYCDNFLNHAYKIYKEGR